MRQSFNVQRIPRLIALCSLAVTVVAGTDVPTFEVTSVKAGAFDANGSSYRSTPGGRLAVSNKEPGEIFVVDHTERPSEN